MSLHDLSDDDRELASLGYKQELTRTLGAFSTFATGFAFISILTGMFLLFAFVYTSGGPASIWAWIVAVLGQLMFALAFAELAVRYPLAGSVYNWTKQLARPGVAWMAGVSMVLALVVSCAAVALAMQTILPSVSSIFWIYGDGTGDQDATINGVILGTITLVLSTAVCLSGTKIKSFVNNAGVCIELVASVVLIVGLLLHAKRGPQVVLETNGTGDAFQGGYLGALMLCLLLGLLVMWGFDTAGSLSEETVNPRRTNPRAIIRAVLASGVVGALLILTAVMSVDDVASSRIGEEGLAYVVTSVLGETLGDVILICAAIAVFVCALANQTGAVNMMFAMARDNALPGSANLGRVAARRGTPVVPTVLVGVIAIVLLVINIGQPAIFLTVTGTTIIFALVSYILVVAPFALVRIRGRWESPKGYFTLGRLGLPVSVIALVWACAMVVNVAWPRPALYNPEPPYHWYLQWGGVLVPAVALAACLAFYLLRQRKVIGIRPEHASSDAAGVSADRRPVDTDPEAPTAMA